MLRAFDEKLRRTTGLAWLVAAVLTVLGVTLAIDRLALAHREADAERAALSWAHHLATVVPDIERIIEGQPPTPQALERLTALRGGNGLFRYKLFDTAGVLQLQSDSPTTRPGAKDQKPEDAQRAVGVAAGAGNNVALKRGDGVKRPELYSEAYVPVVRAGRTVGVVEVYIDQTELAALTDASFRSAALTASSVLTLVLFGSAALLRWRGERNRHAESQVQYLAHHDVLTGAINHATFSYELARACASSGTHTGVDARLAVLCIDLDRFADVNDAHGHGAGDAVLRQVALRLRGVLRGSDVLGRLAGDRFVVLQREADERGDVAALAQRIVDALAQPHVLAGVAAPLAVTAGVGAAIHGIDGNDADALLHTAELALQQAKAGGSSRWSFYDAAHDRALNERRALAADLRAAIADGALKLHFQPLFAARGGAPIGYEALARWHHPDRGNVPPVTFIELAEETGQIHALGRWVLHTACAEAATWPAPLAVAVNLSPAQFRGNGSDIVAEVRAALGASRLAPQRLELEITESLLLCDTEDVLRQLRLLHELGVRIAMDDFGTGYSSLAYLWRFPFDKLKIDRAFTQGLGGDDKVDAIVRSIVGLAHTLAIRVNAEGVETELQCAALRRLGCDELQGYLLGRPQPPEKLVHATSARPAREAALAVS